MSDADKDERYLVPGLMRGIEILRLFNRSRPLLTAPVIAKELGIPRTTVFRLAQTLEHLGLLERVDGGNSYRLALGVLSLGFEYLAALDIVQIAGPFLEKLRDQIDLSVHLVLRDHRHVVVVHKAAGHSAFAGSLSIGARLPAHATVLGRVMLADLDEDEIRALYPNGAGLEAHSRQTPTDLDRLLSILAEDRKRGFAISDRFFESGISALALPLRDASGRAVAAFNVSVPSGGLKTIDTEMIERARATAEDISRALNYSPATGRRQGDAA